MSNWKAEKRKKKLAARRLRADELILKATLRAEFPGICVRRRAKADPEFAAVVREAVRRFDFADLEIYQQSTFKIMREKGSAVAWSTLRKELAAVSPEHPHYEYAKIADIGWLLNIGELTYSPR